jgi:hypothetical protein
MYRCQSCGERFEQFEVLGQCPHCQHLSKVKCACGHTAEGWDFVKNNDCCPKCNRPIRIAGGESEHNREIKERESGRRTAMKVAAVAGAVAVVAVLAGAAFLFLF